jgi:predicted acyltransferase
MAVSTQDFSNRLYSLDVFRGLTMFLLIAEAAGFHHNFYEFSKDSFLEPIAVQLHHHPWHGLRFWDLIQPFFMFIVGVAMPFSLHKRLKTGSVSKVTKHILKRCLLLFVFGVLLHCIYSHELVWELWNVLVQLAFTILIAYTIMNLPHKYQLIISVGLLVLTEVLYRMYHFQNPYNNVDNFGSFMDMIFMGKINNGGWVAINFIPTASHTIWGVICGQLLLSKRNENEKIKIFVIWGIILLLAGYILDLTGITPIVKRIATTSFTLVSGGYTLLVLTLFYWFIDVRKNYHKWLLIFSVVGTNSIFIYLFSETVGIQWFRGFGLIFTEGIFGPLNFPQDFILVLNALFVFFIFWYLTYFLDKHKIYFKI